MICTYCNIGRPQNAAPCPNCGAPSPLQGQSAPTGWGASESQAPSWNNGGWESNGWNAEAGSANAQWNSQPQMASNMPGWPSMPEQNSPSANNQSFPASFSPSTPVDAWGQFSPSMNSQWDSQVPQLSFDASAPSWNAASPGDMQAPAEPPKSLLPVPYQNPMGLQVGQGRDIALPILQSPSLEQMLPALPEDSVYVPPMYTKPRPLIPRYRIFSGILSVVIVSLLLCGGATYYARASGKLTALGRAITGAAPASIQSTPVPNLPDPSTKFDTGPAYSKIPAATTTLRIDKNNTPLQPTRSFKVSQMFYLTFTVPNPGTGTVTAKWYMNNIYYRTTTITSIKKAQGMVNAWMSMSYATAAEGSVELDWNAQMAQRLYFVVRP